jgi:hypothetical protein
VLLLMTRAAVLWNGVWVCYPQYVVHLTLSTIVSLLARPLGLQALIQHGAAVVIQHEVAVQLQPVV